MKTFNKAKSKSCTYKIPRRKLHDLDLEVSKDFLGHKKH